MLPSLKDHERHDDHVKSGNGYLTGSKKHWQSDQRLVSDFWRGCSRLYPTQVGSQKTKKSKYAG